VSGIWMVRILNGRFPIKSDHSNIGLVQNLNGHCSFFNTTIALLRVFSQQGTVTHQILNRGRYSNSILPVLDIRILDHLKVQFASLDRFIYKTNIKFMPKRSRLVRKMSGPVFKWLKQHGRCFVFTLLKSGQIGPVPAIWNPDSLA
jgi:hypothetical protein